MANNIDRIEPLKTDAIPIGINMSMYATSIVFVVLIRDMTSITKLVGIRRRYPTIISCHRTFCMKIVFCGVEQRRACSQE